MPLLLHAERIIKTTLLEISQGGKTPIVSIATFTARQFEDINSARRNLEFHELASNEIVFLGRHLLSSRTKDGYTIEDIVTQIESALSESSVVLVNSKMSSIQSTIERKDGYGNTVVDRAIFEMTQRKPRAELFSIIPKGDLIKPRTQKAHP